MESSHICFTLISNCPPTDPGSCVLQYNWPRLCLSFKEVCWFKKKTKKKNNPKPEILYFKKFPKLRLCNLSYTNLFADKSLSLLMLFCSKPLFTSKGSIFLLSEVPVWSFTQNTKQPNATLSRLFFPPSPIWKRLEEHAFPFLSSHFKPCLCDYLNMVEQWLQEEEKKNGDCGLHIVWVVTASSDILALV